jgi:hypothetical protein
MAHLEGSGDDFANFKSKFAYDIEKHGRDYHKY